MKRKSLLVLFSIIIILVVYWSKNQIGINLSESLSLSDYIPFKYLPSCPRCGAKCFVSIPPCSICGEDGLHYSRWFSDMHLNFYLCKKHWGETKREMDEFENLKKM